jgi:hypothetical protein
VNPEEYPITIKKYQSDRRPGDFLPKQTLKNNIESAKGRTGIEQGIKISKQIDIP